MAYANYDKMIQLLVRMGDLDLNPPGKLETTSVLYAVQMGAHSMLQILLRFSQVDVNYRDDMGRSVLLYCGSSDPKYRRQRVSRYDRHVIKLLLDAGADPNLKDYTGRVALLHVAGRPYACDKSIGLLLSVTNRAELNCKDRYGQTVLLHCICQRRTWVALELIENQDVDPNITDSLGRPPLLYAASIGMEDTVIGPQRKRTST